MKSRSLLPPAGEIDTLIMTVRGHRVMLDAYLARIRGVPTKRFNEQVKRNTKRFSKTWRAAIFARSFRGTGQVLRPDTDARRRGEP